MRRGDGLWAALGAAVLLLSWEGLVAAGLISHVFFPPPSEIAASLLELARSGRLADAIGATLGRTLLGILIGGTVGFALGTAMGLSPGLRGVVDPFVSAVHPLPKIALLPLFFVFFGVGEAPKIVMASLGAFFPLLINTMAGVRQMPDIYFEVARSYGADRRTVLRRVVLPGNAPATLTGLRLAANVALLLVLATELVSAQRGLGATIWYSWQTLRVGELYACLVVLGVIGWALSAMLERAARRWTPWAVSELR